MGSACDPVYVGAPGQVVRDINPQISSTGNNLQDLTMQSVGGINRFPGTCHLHFERLNSMSQSDSHTDSVTNICIKQIMHSFCVYIQSLTTASGSRLWLSGKSIGFFTKRSWVRIPSGSNHFQLCLISLRYGFHVVRWGLLVRDRTLFRQKLALRHHKWWLPRNGGMLRISA